MKHVHHWHYEYAIYSGRDENEVGVVRYCLCGVKQMAFTSDWKRPPKSYDLSTVGET